MPPKVIIGVQEWNIGGPSVFAERLTRGLSELGWDARVLITEEDSERITQRLTPREKPTDIRFDYLPAGYYDIWGQRWDALIRYLEMQAPCIYIMNGDWRNNIVAQRLSNRVRIIGMVHADYALEYDQVARLGRYWNAVVAVSDIIHYNVACRFPEVVPRLLTICNAVPDVPVIPPKPDGGPLKIAYCGELRKTQKKLDDMVRVAHGLAATDTPYELTFIGDGPMRAELETMATPLIEQGKVHFPGRMGGAALLDALAQQHVFLLTSEFEGLSIALLEAMSRGCVPVVSDLSTQSLVIQHDVNSFAVPVGDIDGFVASLVRLYREPDKRQKMADAAFQTIINGGYRVQDMMRSYITLFEQIEARVDDGHFKRQRDPLQAPPQYVDGLGILPGSYYDDLHLINSAPLWPDIPAPPQLTSASNPIAPLSCATSPSGESVLQSSVKTSADSGSLAAPSRTGSGKLQNSKVIVALPGGQVHGVDIFSAHLVRQLRQRGVDARVVGRRMRPDYMGLALPDDIPVDDLNLTRHRSWQRRRQEMISYLEANSPCIYIPNYDYDNSCVAPCLSDRVKVVNIAHADDPANYAHILRLRHVSNAMVGVSSAIMNQILAYDPSLKERLHQIPYGVEIPAFPAREYTASAPLRIVYMGRLLNYERRAEDLRSIARTLHSRGIPFELTIIGEGDQRCHLQYLRPIALHKYVWTTGVLPNEEVQKLLAENDVFLLTSSFGGLSIGLLEAMAHGLVPIVSDVRSGVPELIQEGINGFKVPVGNVDAYVDRLAILYQDPARRERMAQAAYQTVCQQGYGLENMVDRYIELFEQVIAQNFVRPRGKITRLLYGQISAPS